MTFKNIASKIKASLLAWRASPPETGASDPSPDALDVRLDECMDHADRDEDAAFADVTASTLQDMRQEDAHSLERDFSDSFFWRDARPDAVAGMAKVYLKARCPTAYWRELVSANAYGLWAGVLMARMRAQAQGQPCEPGHLQECAFLSLLDQAVLVSLRPPQGEREAADLMRADGLPVPGAFLGDVNKHATARVLFAAIASGRPIDWPDLPARLDELDCVPDKLPALRIDLDTLVAREEEVDQEQARLFWDGQIAKPTRELLLIPDWACWMFASDEGAASFAKWPKRP